MICAQNALMLISATAFAYADYWQQLFWEAVRLQVSSETDECTAGVDVCAFVSVRARVPVFERTFRQWRMCEEKRALSHLSCVRATRTPSCRTKSEAVDWSLLKSSNNSLVSVSSLRVLLACSYTANQCVDVPCHLGMRFPVLISASADSRLCCCSGLTVSFARAHISL